MLPISDRCDRGIYLKLPIKLTITVPYVEVHDKPSPETITFGKDIHYTLSDNITVTFDIDTIFVRFLDDIVIVSPNGRPDIILATDLMLDLYADRQYNETYLQLVGTDTFSYLIDLTELDLPLSWVLQKLTVTFALGTFELPHIVNIEPDPMARRMDPVLQALFKPGEETWYDIKPSLN
jgi:hypothetical protein